jgi:hypothetical protein
MFFGGYKYRDLASKVGESQMRQESMVMDSVQLRPLSDCTANYRPDVLSERAPYMKKKESNCQT